MTDVERKPRLGRLKLVGAAMALGSCGLLVWLFYEAIQFFMGMEQSGDALLALLLLGLTGAVGALAVWVLLAGIRLIRSPGAAAIRRACLALAVVGGLLAGFLTNLFETPQNKPGFGLGLLVSLIAGGIIYWMGSRLLIRTARVPEVMSEPQRQHAVKVLWACWVSPSGQRHCHTLRRSVSMVSCASHSGGRCVFCSHRSPLPRWSTISARFS